MLREVKNSGGGQIVVDCDYQNIRTVLKQAQAVGMMTNKYQYLITSLVITHNLLPCLNRFSSGFAQHRSGRL